MILRRVCLPALCGALLLASCARKHPVAPQETPVVTVSVPLERKVIDYEDFTGRLDAVYTVEVRARVTGYLKHVYFKDGAMVKKDQPLYEIDPQPYEAELAKARGQMQKLLGQKKLVDTQVERYTRLVAKGGASQQDLDVQLGNQAENVGSIAAAEAQIKYAELYLKYCTVKAPIDGQLSRTFLQIGNLIAADQTQLTTLVSIDPMYGYFSVEEPTFPRIQAVIGAGAYDDAKNVEVSLGLADDVERRFPLRGKLDFVNNQFDSQTGTIALRGRFDNSDQKLKPGMFARVRAPIGLKHPVLLVAEQAIGADQGQKFVYVVDDRNVVHYRRVKAGLVFDGLRAIEEGLKPGERIIVNGLQRARPKIEVKPETVDMAKLADPAGAPPLVVPPRKP